MGIICRSQRTDSEYIYIYIYLFQASIRKISALLDYYRVPRKIRDGDEHIQNQLICFLGSIYPAVKPEMGYLGDHHISV